MLEYTSGCPARELRAAEVDVQGVDLKSCANVCHNDARSLPSNTALQLRARGGSRPATARTSHVRPAQRVWPALRANANEKRQHVCGRAEQAPAATLHQATGDTRGRASSSWRGRTWAATPTTPRCSRRCSRGWSGASAGEGRYRQARVSATSCAPPTTAASTRATPWLTSVWQTRQVQQPAALRQRGSCVRRALQGHHRVREQQARRRVLGPVPGGERAPAAPLGCRTRRSSCRPRRSSVFERWWLRLGADICLGHDPRSGRSSAAIMDSSWSTRTDRPYDIQPVIANGMGVKQHEYLQQLRGWAR